jgi:hypothetical protein
VVAAVRGGLLSLEEACQRYTLTTEEFLSWRASRMGRSNWAGGAARDPGRARHRAPDPGQAGSGLLSLEEACQRYTLTTEEFLSWQFSIEQHGLAGGWADQTGPEARPGTRAARGIARRIPAKPGAADDPARVPGRASGPV